MREQSTADRMQINYLGSDGRATLVLKAGTTREQAEQVAADLVAGYAGARPRITTEGSQLWH